MRLGIKLTHLNNLSRFRNPFTTLELEQESAFPLRWSPLYEVFAC